MQMKRTRVTHENIEDVMCEMSTIDQREQLEVGCVTWGITYEGDQRGQMTVWPNGRAAIALGGDSIWGDWVPTHESDWPEDRLLPDNAPDIWYDDNGVEHETEGKYRGLKIDGLKIDLLYEEIDDIIQDYTVTQKMDPGQVLDTMREIARRIEAEAKEYEDSLEAGES